MFHAVTPPPKNPSRDDIVWLAGPRLVGLIFNWALLGVLTIQVYIYHINFPKDRRFLKILVYAVYILDWIQTCSATYDAFQWFVYGWGNIPALYGLFTTFLNVPILSSIIAAIVQIFFGWRIGTLSESRITFVVIASLSLLQLGGGGAVAYYLYNDASEVTRSEGLVRAVGIRLGGSAVVDSVIAISMTYFLVRCRGQGFGRINSVLTRLIRLTIETGTVTAISAVVDLIFFLKVHNGLHQVSGVILCKMYSNTLLVLFNNRLMTTNETMELRGSVKKGTKEQGAANS
ncbi:putative Transmembrane protein [Mycena venus]|uniref:Putative Transmembrane protein n=1 Tax=Mycena venus TaxID=2733690 RepID=A0A8H6Z264_9AGAR|nr:putative Transmembrane protein [Mycena venus]